MSPRRGGGMPRRGLKRCYGPDLAGRDDRPHAREEDGSDSERSRGRDSCASRPRPAPRTRRRSPRNAFCRGRASRPRSARNRQRAWCGSSASGLNGPRFPDRRAARRSRRDAIDCRALERSSRRAGVRAAGPRRPRRLRGSVARLDERNRRNAARPPPSIPIRSRSVGILASDCYPSRARP